MTAHVMTGPEMRRAAGDEPSCECEPCVILSRNLTRDALEGYGVSRTGERVAPMLRALVLQGLCDLLGVTS